jgi:hypothetical protein
LQRHKAASGGSEPSGADEVPLRGTDAVVLVEPAADPLDPDAEGLGAVGEVSAQQSDLGL